MDVLNRAGQEQCMQRKSPKILSKSGKGRGRGGGSQEKKVGWDSTRFHRLIGFSAYPKSQERLRVDVSSRMTMVTDGFVFVCLFIF